MTAPLPQRVYLHQKGGRYLVLFVADDATNARPGNKSVVYSALANGAVYVRDLSEFTEEVPWPDGSLRPRFIEEEGQK